MTRGDLTAAFQPLVDRKIQDGLAVKVATLEDITGKVEGSDVREMKAIGVTSEQRSMLAGKPTAHVCTGFVCQFPVTHPEELARQL